MSAKTILKRIVRRVGVIGLCIACLGLAGSLSTWLFLKYMVKGEIVTTPNLYGKDIEAIQHELDRLGLVLSIDPNRVPSNVVKKDCAVFQTPGPGKKLKKNRIIEVSLSSGPNVKRIPDLVDQSIYFANLMAEKLGTRVAKASRVPSDTFKKGRVIAQTPTEGSEIPNRTGISLLLSEGPQKSWYVMPDVQGEIFSAAKAFFEQNGFRVVSKYKYNAKLLPDEIIRQFPQPGYPVQEKATITFEVNRIK